MKKLFKKLMFMLAGTLALLLTACGNDPIADIESALKKETDASRREMLVEYLQLFRLGESGQQLDATRGLQISLQLGFPEYAKYFIEKGADVREGNPLEFAVLNLQEDCIKSLVVAGADLNSRDFITALFSKECAGTESQKISMAKKLMKLGVKFDEKQLGYSLVVAQKNEKKEIVKFLKSLGISPNIPGVKGIVAIPGENFSIGKYEVTQKEYAEIMEERRLWESEEEFNYPVCGVSWSEAMKYCERLTMLGHASGILPKGYKFTLPTSKQWEIACRAGTKTRFCSGDSEDDLSRVAWWEKNSDNKPHPVGTKEPNAWGIYDMHGSVPEWCLDVLSQVDAVRAVGLRFKDEVLPKGAKEEINKIESMSKEEWVKGCGSQHICRGGGARQSANFCESSLINFDWEGYGEIGFRIVLVPEEKTGETVQRTGRISSKSISGIEGLVLIPNKNFAIGKYEVTQREYESVMGEYLAEFEDKEVGAAVAIPPLEEEEIVLDEEREGNRVAKDAKPVKSRNPARFKGDVRPIDSVSWFDAMKYCEKLTERERESGNLPKGYKYTLPTSEQWEIACCAGMMTRFYSGDSKKDLARVGWYCGNSREETHCVGEKEPNAWGIYDMHGNVMEWCLDLPNQEEVVRGLRQIDDERAKKIADKLESMSEEAWLEKYGLYRVARGGSWDSYSEECESLYIECFRPMRSDDNNGFRVALVPDNE